MKADAGDVPLEPFNMRQEMQEGVFDEEGNYLLRRRTNERVEDPWLNSLDQEGIKVKISYKP